MPPQATNVSEPPKLKRDLPAEQESLKNVLTDPKVASVLGPDVPATLEADPDLRQLTQEAVDIGAGIPPKEFKISTPPPGAEEPVVTAEEETVVAPPAPTFTEQERKEFSNILTRTGDPSVTLTDGRVITREQLGLGAITPVDTGAAAADAFEGAEIFRPPERPERPDVSEIERQITDVEAQGVTPSEIELGLQSTLEGIGAKFRDRKIRLEADLENIRQQSFSDLANVGNGLNPLSSGGRSIQSASDIRRDRALSTEAALESAEIALARAAARGEKTDALERRRATLLDQRERILQDARDEFADTRQAYIDTIDGLNSAAIAAQADETFTSQQRADNLGHVNSLFALAGSKAFDGASDESIRNTEEAAGLPPGSIRSGKERLKELEDKAEADKGRGELRTIDGDLFQVTFDKEGKATTRLVQAKRRGVDDDGIDPDAELLSFSEFEQLAASETDTAGNPLFDNSAQARDAYKEYVGEFEKSRLSTLNRQKMIARGLDPAVALDVFNYIQENFGIKGADETTKTTDTVGAPTLDEEFESVFAE